MMLSGAPQIEVIGEADDGRGVLAAVPTCTAPTSS